MRGVDSGERRHPLLASEDLPRTTEKGGMKPAHALNIRMAHFGGFAPHTIGSFVADLDRRNGPRLSTCQPSAGVGVREMGTAPTMESKGNAIAPCVV